MNFINVQFVGGMQSLKFGQYIKRNKIENYFFTNRWQYEAWDHFELLCLDY